MCLQLKRTGHFDYDRYDNTFELKELQSASQQLKAEYEDWVQNLITCRRNYYYMNFIHPAQLQQLFGYLCKNTGNERNILTCLQFIDTNFNNVQALRNQFQSLPEASNNREILQNISLTLQDIFKNHFPPRQKLAPQKKESKITDIVQAGVPYIAALNADSPLVIRTMFALYMNTTNSLPNANQILLL
ncbi:unnamed protein product [Mytilus edulis]|uniref:Uncharacterized protein n=1 Tax=Mytilus edulis TaxID=6550 RepID=A0A8S3RM55_MYTED|nr:unnamed protein product [Mytilus edulis]